MKQTIVQVRARVRELAGETVESLIGPVRMASIRAMDPAPMFIELIVGHEGVSKGEVVGLGARVKQWARKVIARLSELLHPSGRTAAEIFDGSQVWHGAQSTRQPCGEVLHSRSVESNGRLESKAIGYIFAGQTSAREAIRRGDLNTCSVEADVILAEDAGRSVVEDVIAATAVVLGNSNYQRPGFEGARVAMITEFEPVEGDPPADPPSADPPANPPAQPPAPAPAPAPPPAAPTMSREQLLQAIKDAGITAADLGAPAQPQAPPAPPAAPPPAPPERQPNAPASNPLDFTRPENNEFLPQQPKT